jgi:hypothetical protein
VFDWVRKGVADLDVYGAIVSVGLEQTIEGAPSVKITLRDPNMRVLSEAAGRVVDRTTLTRKRGSRGVNPAAVDEGWEPIYRPSLIGRAVDVTLDDVTFRLTGVSYSSATGEATLTFEHRLVYWLRRKRGARRAKRDATTRAQFVLSLVREIKAARYRFVCPELNVRQPIGAATSSRGLRAALLSQSASSSTSSSARRATQSHDVARVLDKTYPRHRIGAPGAARLSERQVRAAAELAGLSPTDALHAAQIAHGESNYYPGVVQDDPGDGMIGHGLWQMTPHAWGSTSAAYHHMQSLGGVNAMRSPIQCARMMAYLFKQSGNTWRQWYGVKYLNLSSHATKSVLAEGVSADLISTAEGGAASGTYVKSYQFARNANEDSWTAMQRLAQEVGWRCFVVGNTIYYMSEGALYGRRTRYMIEPDDSAVLDLSYDMDWGKPVSECTLQVVLERWGAAPGSVVELDGYGPPDGRWLVATVTRDYFTPTAEVTLKQPGPAKMEPAAETGVRATSDGSAGSLGWEAGAGSSVKGARLYAECKRISDAGGPYVYGGGHGGVLSSLRSGQGLDCSSSTSLALYRAGLFKDSVAWVSGKFATSYGVPGRGSQFTVWANGGHVWVQLHTVGSAWRFDTSPYGSGGHGPRLRFTERPTSGFTPRHWPGM